MKKFTFLLKLIIPLIAFLFILQTPDIYPQQASLWDQFPEEIRERNSFKRFEWFYRQRAYPYDTISYHTYLYELEIEIQKEIESSQNSNSNLQWNSIGPAGLIYLFPSHWGEMSGRTRGLAVHPIDPNIVYIGAAAGSIWKTTNGGSTWTNVGDDLSSLTYGAIAIDPNNPNTVFAGAGEILYNFSKIIYDGRGLYKTTDGGTNWIHITDGFGSFTHFGDLEVSPHNSNIIFAALGSGYSYLGNLGNEGVWRSTDAGNTWTKTLNVIDAFDVIVHPTNANLVYAATGGGSTTSGFYVSNNSGATWTQSSTGLPASSSILRMQISLANSSPSIIYALIYNGSGTPVAYKTTNSGTSWNQISAGIQLGGNYGSGWRDQGGYDLCIAVNPSNASHVFVGNVELHETTDGSTFSVKRVAPGSTAWNCPTHTDIHRIVFSPSNSNVVFLACDGGIFKSIDGGNNWSSANNGISTIQFYRIASHPTKHDTLIGGAQDNGNFRTFNAGATAWISTTTGDGMECFFDHSNLTTLYLSTQNGNLGKSVNLGISVNWLINVNGSWITPFFMHPTNNQWLYTANNSVLRSTNGGSSFSVIASNVSTSDKINTMAQSSINPNNMIFAGSGWSTNNPQVKVSTDGGFTWSDVTGTIPGPNRYITRVVCHPTNTNSMY
ncbi:MAG: WD40/YVTN/BNR-like repeat-containing protein, partial [Candidatus Kariarchaeaceae archaeon]